MDADDIEAVKQIFAEQAGLDSFFQILMGGGDDAYIHLDGGLAAHPVELAVGEYPQQPGLTLGRHVADFIQKQRAAVRLFKTAAASGGGAGEGTPFVAEQFRFQQVAGDGRSVQGNEGFVGARTVAMQRPRHQFLAGAGFAVDQHRDVGAGQTANGAEYLLHGRRLTDDLGGFAFGFRVLYRLAAVLIDGALHQVHGLIHVEGLGHVFEGAALIGGYRTVQIGVGGHDDHRNAGVLAVDVVQ